MKNNNKSIFQPRRLGPRISEYLSWKLNLMSVLKIPKNKIKENKKGRLEFELNLNDSDVVEILKNKGVDVEMLKENKINNFIL